MGRAWAKGRVEQQLKTPEAFPGLVRLTRHSQLLS
jgi:hypothetical protein